MLFLNIVLLVVLVGVLVRAARGIKRNWREDAWDIRVLSVAVMGGGLVLFAELLTTAVS